MDTKDLTELSTADLKTLLEQKKIEVSKNKVMQKGLKVTLNSAYGMIGNQYSRYYDLRIAEGITVSGQLSIRWIERKINAYLNKLLKTEDENFVIAGDTDSIYFTMKPLIDKVLGGKKHDKDKIVSFLDKICHEKFEPFIDKCYEELAEYMNAYAQKMFMKREVIADRGIWRAKKNYALHVYDSEGVRYDQPELKIMGLESTRSSTPEMCRKAFKSVIRVVMTDTEEAVQGAIKAFKKTFMSAPVEDISFPRGVSDIDKWTVPDDAAFMSKTPIHVKAALTYNRLIRKFGLEKKYRLIQNGDKLKFVYLVAGNVTRNNAIAFIDNLPPEFELDDDIDRVLQFTKSFQDPIKSILDVIGWHIKKVNTIEGLFDE